MSAPEFHVAGLGNAIVDVLAHADDTFLIAHGIEKGGMTLIDEDRAQTLYDALGQTVQVSGGSAANTIAGIASLGGKAAFIGKVRNDQLGGIFRHDIRAAGVAFDTPPADRGPPTARSLILVTPDAQRSMNTYLGACVGLGPQDVAPELVQSSKVTYLEGYLFDPPAAKEAFVKAAELAHTAGRKVALSLSDPFCVERHRGAFRHLVEGHVDLLFANLEEAKSLTGTASLEDAAAALAGKAEVVVVTRSEKGALILAEGRELAVEALPPARLVDTTGAGDLFAAGFLRGYTAGLDRETSARLGNAAASHIIQQIGPRPQTPLVDLPAVKAILGKA